MKLSAISLLLILSFQSKIFGQNDLKSESEILAGIEWISTNPVEQADKEFVSKCSDYIYYQVVNYPNFPINFSALKEFMSTDRKYKYYDEINIVFTSNQLANKIKTGNKYDLEDSSIKSMNKVLEYYKLLLEIEPDQSNLVLDEYSKMSKVELEKVVKTLVKK